MAKTIGLYRKTLSLTEHKNRVRRAQIYAPKYTNFYYKDYKKSGGKLSLRQVLQGK